MTKLLAVCGNGMGTSHMMKIIAKEILDSHSIECIVDNKSIREAKKIMDNYDIVIVSTYFSKKLKNYSHPGIIALQSILDKKEMEAKLLKIILD